MDTLDSEEAWKHITYVIRISKTSSDGSRTYELISLKFSNNDTLRSRKCSILVSSIWNKMTSKFANYSTLRYSRMSLRHHLITFWVCKVIYKSMAIERTSNHTLTTRSCWAMTPPHQKELRYCTVLGVTMMGMKHSLTRLRLKSHIDSLLNKDFQNWTNFFQPITLNSKHASPHAVNSLCQSGVSIQITNYQVLTTD